MSSRKPRTRIYIAGPISGLPQVSLEEKKARFYRAQTNLLDAGYDALVPLDVPVDNCSGGCNPDGHIGQDGVPTHGWGCFMKHDLRALLWCDELALLPGWEESRGTLLELEIAKACAMPVTYLDEAGVPITPE